MRWILGGPSLGVKFNIYSILSFLRSLNFLILDWLFWEIIYNIIMSLVCRDGRKITN